MLDKSQTQIKNAVLKALKGNMVKRKVIKPGSIVLYTSTRIYCVTFNSLNIDLAYVEILVKGSAGKLIKSCKFADISIYEEIRDLAKKEDRKYTDKQSAVIDGLKGQVLSVCNRFVENYDIKKFTVDPVGKDGAFVSLTVGLIGDENTANILYRKTHNFVVGTNGGLKLFSGSKLIEGDQIWLQILR